MKESQRAKVTHVLLLTEHEEEFAAEPSKTHISYSQRSYVIFLTFQIISYHILSPSLPFHAQIMLLFAFGAIVLLS